MSEVPHVQGCLVHKTTQLVSAPQGYVSHNKHRYSSMKGQGSVAVDAPVKRRMGRACQGAGCRVQGAGCRVRVQGAGCRVQGSGCRVQGARCRVQGAGFRVQGSWFRVQGLGRMK